MKGVEEGREWRREGVRSADITFSHAGVTFPSISIFSSLLILHSSLFTNQRVLAP